MNDGIGQAAIAVMVGIGEVQGVRRQPVAQPRAGPRLPGEGSGRHRLARSVDRHGAVSGRAPKEVPPVGFRRVGVGPGIDEVGLPEYGALNAQEVGVTVPAAHRTAERTDVEDQVMSVRLPPAPHDGVAAFGEDPRAWRSRRGRRGSRGRVRRRRPEQPKSV